MRIGSPSSPSPAESARLVRVAWLVSFAVTLALIAGLLLVKSAQAEVAAAPVAAPFAALAFADEDEADEEVEFEEFEEDEEEAEDAEGSRRGGEPPAECGLRTARAAAVADESQARLRTQLSYTSFGPVDVAIEFRLSGGKGALTLGRSHRRLGASGVLHGSERLGRAQLAKVLAARSVTLTVRVLDAPPSCRRYFDRHLRSRRAVGDQVAWQQSDSVFGG